MNEIIFDNYTPSSSFSLECAWEFERGNEKLLNLLIEDIEDELHLPQRSTKSKKKRKGKGKRDSKYFEFCDDWRMFTHLRVEGCSIQAPPKTDESLDLSSSSEYPDTVPKPRKSTSPIHLKKKNQTEKRTLSNLEDLPPLEIHGEKHPGLPHSLALPKLLPSPLGGETEETILEDGVVEETFSVDFENLGRNGVYTKEERGKFLQSERKQRVRLGLPPMDPEDTIQDFIIHQMFMNIWCSGTNEEFKKWNSNQKKKILSSRKSPSPTSPLSSSPTRNSMNYPPSLEADFAVPKLSDEVVDMGTVVCILPLLDILDYDDGQDSGGNKRKLERLRGSASSNFEEIMIDSFESGDGESEGDDDIEKNREEEDELRDLVEEINQSSSFSKKNKSKSSDFLGSSSQGNSMSSSYKLEDLGVTQNIEFGLDHSISVKGYSQKNNNRKGGGYGGGQTSHPFSEGGPKGLTGTSPPQHRIRTSYHQRIPRRKRKKKRKKKKAQGMAFVTQFVKKKPIGILTPPSTTSRKRKRSPKKILPNIGHDRRIFGRTTQKIRHRKGKLKFPLLNGRMKKTLNNHHQTNQTNHHHFSWMDEDRSWENSRPVKTALPPRYKMNFLATKPSRFSRGNFYTKTFNY